MNYVTKEQIVFSLQLMGVEKGDVIFMHSALSSMGNVDGGADTVIDAILEAIGEEGTLAVSTLTFVEHFDAKTTPSGVGAISEVLRKRPDAVRSLTPIHSIAAIGGRAKELVADHEKHLNACGLGTPYFKLRDWGAKILLLGVDMNRNTTLHGIEDIMDSCYLENWEVDMPTYVDDYKGKKMMLTKFPPGHRDFLRSTPILRRAGALKDGYIGNAVVKVISVADMFDILIDKIADEPLYFMCDNPACEYCENARRLLKERLAKEVRQDV